MLFFCQKPFEIGSGDGERPDLRPRFDALRRNV